MRILVAGATGVIGVRIVPLLVAAGHVVGGLTRSAEKAGMLRDAGAEPIVCDVYDRERLIELVTAFGPDAVIHELTDLPDDLAEVRGSAAANARIRTEGTANLIAAARAAGTTRLLAQSIAWDLPPGVGADAVAQLERAVQDVDGTVLRYGQFYGPGTYHPDEPPEPPRVHLDRAARATIEALDAAPGVLVITD